MSPFSGFAGTQRDPLTGRMISARCWNGTHESPKADVDWECRNAGCECGCHHEDEVPKDDGKG